MGIDVAGQHGGMTLAWPSAGVDPLALMRDDHEVQHALCDDLESVADMLPDLPDASRLRRLCQRMESVTIQHFGRAEALFETLWPAPSRTAPQQALLDMLARMHIIDSVHGQHLATVMWDAMVRTGAVPVGELGYMLRCFFDGCRRAIAYREVMMMLMVESSVAMPDDGPFRMRERPVSVRTGACLQSGAV